MKDTKNNKENNIENNIKNNKENNIEKEIEKEKTRKAESAEKKSTTDSVAESKKPNRKLLYILAFVIPFVVAFIALAIGGFAPFGDKDVLTAGGFEKYRYFLNDLHDKVHEGSVNTSGYASASGYDISDSLAYYLSDPTNLVTLLFSKSDMAGVLNLLYAFKLGLAGLFFCFFLSYRKKNELLAKSAEEEVRVDIISAYKEKLAAKKAAKLEEKKKKNSSGKDIEIKLGGNDEPTSKAGIFIKEFDIVTLALSITYALSAYMVGSGLNVTWLGAVVLFPLLMLAIERLITEGKWLMYCITLAASFILNFYISIIVCIFTLLYFFLQDFKDTKHIVISTIYKLVSDILAVGMASFVIIPSLRSDLMKRMLSLEFPLAQTKVKIFDVFKYQLTGLRTNTAKDTLHLAIYAGIFTLMMIFLYASNGNINFNKKLKTIGLTVVLYIATFHSTLNYLFNGFNYTREPSTVFGFILIFMFLSMAYSVFINIEHQRSVTVLAAFVITLAIIFMALLKSSNYTTMSPFMTSFELAALYFFIIILYKNENMTHTVFKTAMGSFMMLEMVLSFCNNMKSAGNTSTEYADTYVGKYEAAEDYIRATRDKDAKVSVFIDGDNASTPLTNMLSGYDYVIAYKHTGHIVDGLEFEETYNDVDIYKNKYVVKNGFYVNDNILKLVYDNEEIFTSNNYMANNTLGGEDLYKIISGELDVLRAYNVMTNQLVKSTNQYQINFVPTESGNLYGTLNANLTHVGESEKDERAVYYYRLQTKPLLHHETNAQFALFYLDAFDDLYNKMIRVDKTSDNTYSINSDKDGYALIPVTSESWATDNVVEYYTINDACFALVEVKPGSNTYDFSRQNLLFIYIFIALVCLTVCILLSKSVLKAGTMSESGFISGISRFSYNNNVYIITFAIMSLVFVAYLFIRSAAPFGDGFFPSHDGIAQTFPITYRYMNDLFSGDFSTVDYSVGMVQGAIGKIFLLLKPLYYLIGLFPLSSILICFTLIAYIKFILPAWTFIFYLTHRSCGKRMDKKDLRLIPFALAYSLSGYLIAFMSHHGFITIATLLPILMLGFERLIYKKKVVLYVILLTYIMMNDFYMAFLICEFIFLYFFCQSFDNIKDMFVKGIRVAFYSLIAAGLAAVYLIPSYLSTVSKSPYHTNDATIPSFSITSDLINNFKYAKIAPPAVIIDKTSNASVNMYCGLLVLLLVPLYLFCKKINLSERVRKTALLVLYVVSFSNPLLNYVMHGFHNQIFVPNRFSIFYIFILITMVYDLVLNTSEEPAKKKLLSFYGWALVLGILFIASAKKLLTFSTVISLIFIAIYALLVTIYLYKKNKKLLSKIIALVFILELLITAFNYTKYTIYSTHINTELNSYNNVSTLVTRNNLKNAHTRTEYLSSQKNSAWVINTESVSFFTSNINQENLDMIGLMGADVPAITNNIGYVLSNPISDLFLNVKYHIINQYFKVNSTYTFMNKIDEINNISLYENPYNVGFGFLIKNDNPLLELNNDIKNDEAIYDTYIDFQDEIAYKLTGQSLYEQIEFETDPDKINNDPTSTFVMSDYRHYVEGDPDSYVTVCIGIGEGLTGDFYLNYGYFTHLSSKTDEDQEILYLQMQADQYEYYLGNTFYLVKLNEDTLQKLHDVLSESVMYDIHDDGNDIIGTIDASSDGMVYVSLPYKDSFKVYVDNKEVEITSLFKGIGIPVTAGKHQICIRYIHKGLSIGIIISIATLIFFIAFMVFSKMFLRKRTDSADESENNTDDTEAVKE